VTPDDPKAGRKAGSSHEELKAKLFKKQLDPKLTLLCPSTGQVLFPVSYPRPEAYSIRSIKTVSRLRNIKHK